MGKKLAIKGHTTRAKEVVGIFQMLGGCKSGYEGQGENYYYYINKHGNIEGSVHPTDFDEYMIFTLEEFIDKFPYKIGDKVYWIYSKDSEQPIYTINKMIWNGEEIVYQIVTHGCQSRWWSAGELKPIGYCTMPNQGSNDTKKIAWFHFWDDDFADKVELDLTNRELIQENGRYFVVKKKPVYPKTFKACSSVINEESAYAIGGYKGIRLYELQCLLICRKAYWKIAGEQMGLGKPWHPDWTTSGQDRYTIETNYNKFIFSKTQYGHRVLLVFPTKEMRDAFYENFKDLIENCKEFL